MKIYLIGMPGSGKTTIGKELAKKLNISFVDLDEEIEKSAMMFVDEIFEAYGEKYFRDLESNCLKEFMEANDVIISCGGGIIVNKKNKDFMNGKIVLINTELEILAERVKNDSQVRPVLQEKSLFTLYSERLPLYKSFANIEVKNNGDIDSVIKEVMEAI